MITMQREEAFRLWQKWWDEMNKEWFKVEVLQDYTGEDDSPSLRAWKAGDKIKSKELLLQSNLDVDWVEDANTKVKQGVKLRRLHVVDEPLTPYIEWELMVYKLRNVPIIGEEVSLILKRDIGHLSLPKGDMMIFDDRQVAVNTYNEEGRMVGINFYNKQEGDDIAQFLKLKQELQKLGQPLSKF